MRKLTFILSFLPFFFARAQTQFCSKNVYGTTVICTSNYESCASEARRMGGGQCEKGLVKRGSKSVDPDKAQKGTCLWMERGPQWQNLGCMETKEICKYAQRQYSSQAKVECR